MNWVGLIFQALETCGPKVRVGTRKDQCTKGLGPVRPSTLILGAVVPVTDLGSGRTRLSRFGTDTPTKEWVVE